LPRFFCFKNFFKKANFFPRGCVLKKGRCMQCRNQKQKGGGRYASVFMACGHSGKCRNGGGDDSADSEEADGAGKHVRNAQPGSAGGF